MMRNKPKAVSSLENSIANQTEQIDDQESATPVVPSQTTHKQERKKWEDK